MLEDSLIQTLCTYLWKMFTISVRCVRSLPVKRCTRDRSKGSLQIGVLEIPNNCRLEVCMFGFPEETWKRQSLCLARDFQRVRRAMKTERQAREEERECAQKLSLDQQKVI